MPKTPALPMRILIAPEEFKGALTTAQAAQAIARGWRNALPLDTLDVLPISDGGDGFGEVLGALIGAQRQPPGHSMPHSNPALPAWFQQVAGKVAARWLAQPLAT